MYLYSWNLFTCSLQLVLLCSSHCLWSRLYRFTRSPSLLIGSSYSGLRSCDTNLLLHLNLHFAEAIMSCLRFVHLIFFVFTVVLVPVSSISYIYTFLCLSCLIFLYSYLSFTVTETDQRRLKCKECYRFRLKTSIKKSTQAFKGRKRNLLKLRGHRN